MERRRTFSREFKLEVVRLVTERGVAVTQAAKDLDVHEIVLRKWVCVRASFTATAPRVRAGCGTTCWSKVSPVGRTASSGSCENRHCVPGPDGVDYPKTGVSAVPWLTTCWTVSSRPMARTRSGWPTSPISGRPRAGLCGGGAGPVLAAHRRLVDVGEHDLAI